MNGIMKAAESNPAEIPQASVEPATLSERHALTVALLKRQEAATIAVADRLALSLHGYGPKAVKERCLS